MSNQVFLTKEGLNKLKEELDNLQSKSRPETVERLSLARMQGDLSENTEYASAREQLSFIDGRIEELEEITKNAQLIDESKKVSGCVCLGCKVTIKVGSNENVYHIVGEWEANPGMKKVSHSSPLGHALLGKKVGDDVEFEAPAGRIVFKIVKIE